MIVPSILVLTALLAIGVGVAAVVAERRGANRKPSRVPYRTGVFYPRVMQ